MSVRVHPRIMRRRAQVREFGARSQLRRLLRLLIVVALAAALLWFAQSPVFSVAEVSIRGSVQADVDQILAGAEVYVGRPLILIRTGRVEDALEADLWIKSAEVHRRFPNGVEVEIVERVEVAAAAVGGSWVTLSDDGFIIRTVAEPGPELAAVLSSLKPGAVGSPGDPVTTRALVAAIEFATALPPEVRAITELSTRLDQLWASIGEHEVRLGAFTDMEAKGLALAALLLDGELLPNATIDLIAPSRPAVGQPTTGREAGPDSD